MRKALTLKFSISSSSAFPSSIVSIIIRLFIDSFEGVTSVRFSFFVGVMTFFDGPVPLSKGREGLPSGVEDGTGMTP